ncbi:MAG: hypothetical protein ACT4NY_14420 [Pseudonocardiales bacterium]
MDGGDTVHAVRLKAFFTPEEIAGVDEATFRERDRLGYRATYLGRFAEFFTTHDPNEVDHVGKAELIRVPDDQRCGTLHSGRAKSRSLKVLSS